MTDVATFSQRYDENRVPWDNPEPPPEVIALAAELPPGRALDLGCGYGRASIYLAQCGWEVDGVDFVPKAVEIARQRAAAAGIDGHARFYNSSTAELGYLSPAYDLAIDVGCMHSFDDETLNAYRNELDRLIAPGGRVVVFAHLSTEPPVDGRPRGISEKRLLELFDQGYRLERKEFGVTVVEDRPPWESGWFWFRRD